MWQPVEGGVTAPSGFAAASARAGIRYEGRDDVALVASDRPCAVAAVFTTNRAEAAPVTVSREHAAGGVARAVVVNAGCANCGTGQQGLADARAMAAQTAAALGCPPEQVLVASTGVIGPTLPMDRVSTAIAAAARGLGPDGGAAAAAAIMTTDTRSKQAARRAEVGARTLTVGGMAKGVGMIHPNMATMLAFVTTDAPVDATDLAAAVRRVADRSFNCISVDGDQSTNDTLAVLANGAAGGEVLRAGSDGFATLEAGLLAVCVDLAKQLAADGEGATRLVEVEVSGAATDAEARHAARAVISSALVKAAVFGRDANWGRLLCALGNAGADFSVDDVSVRIGDLVVAERGAEVAFDEAAASAALGSDVVAVAIRIGHGPGRGTAWGCDLTYDYVKINASYRS